MHQPMSARFRSPALSLLVLVLVVTGVAYASVLRSGFVWDDGDYILRNRQVFTGLSAANLRWAFTSFACYNWHPLTWVSHQADVTLFGLTPLGHHLVNLLLHGANTALLLLVLLRLTGDLGRSLFVSALFALHPMHVESVAWVSERKDVLSAFFWMLTLLSYLRYVRLPTRRRYLPVLFCFAVGLMAKPMLVTLPFVLLLLDAWPLDRAYCRPAAHGFRQNSRCSLWVRLASEKTPLFALAAISCLVTYLAQARGGAVASLENLPLTARLANAAYSYLKYLGGLVWPARLSFFYTDAAAGVSAWVIAGAFSFLAALTVAALALRRRQPAVTTGWLWFLGTMVPVIGIVQVGLQARADRYTYLPFIGVFMAAAWGLPALLPPRLRQRSLMVLAGGALVAMCSVLTWRQVQHWRSSFDLYTAAIAVNPDNFLAHTNLAVVLKKDGRSAEAIGHLREAIRIKPTFQAAHLNLGLALSDEGRAAEALVHLEQALQLEPDSDSASVALGLTLAALGQTREALARYAEVLERSPGNALAHLSMANLLDDQGEFEKALPHYQEAQQLEPENEQAFYDLGVALERRGRREEAVTQYRQALRIKPDYRDAEVRLGVLRSQAGTQR